MEEKRYNILELNIRYDDSLTEGFFISYILKGIISGDCLSSPDINIIWRDITPTKLKCSTITYNIFKYIIRLYIPDLINSFIIDENIDENIFILESDKFCIDGVKISYGKKI